MKLFMISLELILLKTNFSKGLITLSISSVVDVCFTAQTNDAAFLYFFTQGSVIYVAKEVWSKEINSVFFFFEEIHYYYLRLVGIQGWICIGAFK